SRLYYHFFFQAEDGIRDRTVTGVQTCALPISSSSFRRLNSSGVRLWAAMISVLIGSIKQKAEGTKQKAETRLLLAAYCLLPTARSEERRVGKECRSYRWPDHAKNKKKDMRVVS